jgi:GAF domain
VPAASRAWKVAELERLATSGLDVAAFQAEALRRLRALLTIDAAFFATVDPETLLFTGASSEEPLVEAASLFLENEFGRDDVNKFASLASAADPVSSLDVATRGDRAGSARFREVMAPLGLGDELRVALMSRRRCWGVLCLHRAVAATGFDDDEIARPADRAAPRRRYSPGHRGGGCEPRRPGATRRRRRGRAGPRSLGCVDQRAGRALAR